AAVIGHGEVEQTVVVHVPHHQGDGETTDAEGAGILEGAVAVAQEHSHAAAAIVGHGEVEPAVAVEVFHRHGMGAISGGEGPRTQEAGVAVAQEPADRVIGVPQNPGVGRGKVEQAVVVHVSHSHGSGVPSGGKGAGVLEGAIAVAQEHSYRVNNDAVHHGEI